MHEKIRELIRELQAERVYVRTSPEYSDDEYDHGYVGGLYYAIRRLEGLLAATA